MSDFITIGGKRMDINLRLIDCENLKSRFEVHSRFALKLAKKGINYNFANFLFWSVWHVMDKKYIWPFRKPFRSFRKMRKSILKDEWEDVKNFVSDRILDIEREDKEKKNEIIQ